MIKYSADLCRSSSSQSLKPLLHALLVSGNVPTLSLANNKRIKSKGWKLIAIFLRKVSCILTVLMGHL